MEIIESKEFEGERSLFNKKDLIIRNCIFHDGESPLKEGQNFLIHNSTFSWKYPLWYCESVKVYYTKFEINARAGIWYSKHLNFKDCIFESPKMFRRCDRVSLENIQFIDGEETLWECDNVTCNNILSKGPYLFMNSKNLIIHKLKLDGNYPFDGCENVKIYDSILNSKDAFWNCKNVYAKNCKIIGEYIGWNSEDVVFEDCEIESLQGFCYMNHVKLINCKLKNTTLAFEYSTIDVVVTTSIDSVKNPLAGRIVCKSIGELIMDKEKIDPELTKIEYKG